jgi:hypothetical protein
MAARERACDASRTIAPVLERTNLAECGIVETCPGEGLGFPPARAFHIVADGRNRCNDSNLAAASGAAATSHFRRIRHANHAP